MQGNPLKILNFSQALAFAGEVQDITSEDFGTFLTWCDRRPDCAEEIFTTLCNRFKAAVEIDRREIVSVLFYFSLHHEGILEDLQEFATKCINQLSVLISFHIVPILTG